MLANYTDISLIRISD